MSKNKNKTKMLLRAIEQFRVCGYCGEEVSYEIYGANYATIDHIIPKSKGGSEALENKTLCCLGCNRGKGNRIHQPNFTFADLKG